MSNSSTDNASSADNQQERLKFSGWIVGFVDGEGCFSVSIFKNKTTKSGFQVMPEFVITQGQKSISSLEEIKNFFGCGAIYINRRYDNHIENIYRYCVRCLEDLNGKIIPFFKTNQLRTSKKEDFQVFCRAVEMMINRQHLTEEGLKVLRDLKNPQRLIRQTPQEEKIESELCSDAENNIIERSSLSGGLNRQFQK